MNKKLGLFIYCIVHLLVDAACCLMMLSQTVAGNENTQNLATAIVIYNTLAFAL